MKRTLRLAASLALTLAFAAQAAARQTPPAKTDQPAQTAPPPSATEAAPGVRTIEIEIVVSDSKGQIVEVAKEDLRLFAGDVERPIKSFKREMRPVSYGLVVDNSGSLRTQINYVISAAKALVTGNGPGDEAFAVRFVSSDSIRIMQGLTDRKGLLHRALDEMYVEGGQTAITDALYLSAEYLAKRAPSGGEGGDSRRKVLVLISDGEDRASYYKPEQLFKLLKQHRIQVFCIGLPAMLEKGRGFGKSGARGKATDFLKRLAAETGGELYLAEKIDELQEAVNNVHARLHARHVLSFEMPAVSEDKKTPKIEVKAVETKAKDKLKVSIAPADPAAGDKE